MSDIEIISKSWHPVGERIVFMRDGLEIPYNLTDDMTDPFAKNIRALLKSFKGKKITEKQVLATNQAKEKADRAALDKFQAEREEKAETEIAEKMKRLQDAGFDEKQAAAITGIFIK